MKAVALSLIVALVSSSLAVAQDAAPVRSSMATRPPNVANPPGTDSGNGVACNLLTNYGAEQAAGNPSLPYGPGIAPQSTVPVPDAAPAGGAAARAARPARPAGAPAPVAIPLGAAGMAQRGTIIPDAPVLPYENVEAPNPPQGSQFANVASVGLLKNGHLIAFQRLPMFELMEYDQNNNLLRSFDPNIVSRPHAMFIDKDDNIWLSDQQCDTVVKINSRGDVLMRLGTNGKAGTWNEATGDHLFNEPTAVAVGPNGDIFVATGHGGPDPRVVRFDKNGKFITTWPIKHADGSAPVVHTLVVNDKGEVWVGDREVKVIRVYSINGSPLRDIQMDNLICGLYIDAKGQLWMTTGMDG